MSVNYSIQKISSIIHGQLHGFDGNDQTVKFLLTDSRRLIFPLSTLFFAIKTPKNNGHKYIGELVEKGVAGFVVSDLPRDISLLKKASFILVKDTLLALQELAAWHRKQFTFPVTGITGSNGKTIVKEWLSQIIAEKFSIVKSPRSYNSQIGVPLSVWQMDESHQFGIFEAGISQAGEMENLQKVIDPDMGIFTNVGPAHDEGFVDTRSKIFEKLTLFNNSSILIYRSDNALLDECILEWARNKSNLKLFKWGMSESSDLQILDIRKTEKEYQLSVVYQNHDYPFIVPFIDEASLENAIHCIAFLVSQDYNMGWIAGKITKLHSLAMRLEMKQAINNCSLINDTYNSDLYSLGIALDFLLAQVQHKEKTLILSDILQTGIPAGKLYSDVAELLKEKKINNLIGIGSGLNEYHHCFKTIKAVFFPDTPTFLSDFDFNELQNQAILIKGARDFGFERISNKLQLKDHQTILEINLDALVHNLNVYKAILKPGVRIMAMVKAFSYGSGSHEIAGVMQYHQVDYLAVAFADEGNDLRNAGIIMPIVVLNPELHNLDVLFRYRLEPEVYSLDLLQRLISESLKFKDFDRQNPFPIHIKLDTGMHRLGFMEHELDELISLLKTTPALKVESVFSHLAASDLADFDDFTRQQFSRFGDMSRKMEKKLGYNFLRHILNSAGISRFPDYQYDMVRLGIGLYGVDGNKNIESLLHNVSTFKSVISQVKNIPAGDTVGYNRSGKVDRDTRLAIVPAGYADGLDRRLGNGKGYLMVNGQKAPTVGNISMDMCAVDITGLKAGCGDEVIIFGKEIPVGFLAQKLETIPYEIFTSVSARVKRVYFQE